MMGYPFDACLSMEKKEMGKKKGKKVSITKSPLLHRPYWCLHQDLPSSYFESHKSCKPHPICIFGEAYCRLSRQSKCTQIGVIVSKRGSMK